MKKLTALSTGLALAAVLLLKVGLAEVNGQPPYPVNPPTVEQRSPTEPQPWEQQQPQVEDEEEPPQVEEQQPPQEEPDPATPAEPEEEA